MAYLDDRAVPRVNTGKAYMTLGKRDHTHFDNSGATIAETPQMIYDALRWTCAASVMPSRGGQNSYHIAGCERKCPCGACAGSDSRAVRRRARQLRTGLSSLNPSEGGLSAGAHSVSSRGSRSEQHRPQQSERGGIDTGDDDRSLIRSLSPQWLGGFESPPLRGALETPGQHWAG